MEREYWLGRLFIWFGLFPNRGKDWHKSKWLYISFYGRTLVNFWVSVDEDKVKNVHWEFLPKDALVLKADPRVKFEGVIFDSFQLENFVFLKWCHGKLKYLALQECIGAEKAWDLAHRTFKDVDAQANA